MKTFTKPASLAVLAGLAVWLTPVDAQVQNGKPFPNTFNYINPNPYVAPGLKLNQWQYNTATVGKTYAQLPPWMFGYNPYPSVANYGPVYQPNFRPPVYSPYNNPYNGGYSSGGYSPGGYTSPIDPYGGYSAGGYSPIGGYDPYNPYGTYGDGGYLRGQADVMRSYGQLANNLEQARLGRELVNQAKLETQKKTLELQNWIRDNTLTFTQEQERIAAMTVKRVERSATQAEIWSGRAQNILLKDLATRARKGATQPFPLDEEVFKQLNVTSKGGNLGLVRNEGAITYPTGLRSLSDAKDYNDLLNEISLETKRAYHQAVGAKLDGKLVRDLRTHVDQLRERLAAKVNEIPISQTLESKRFLNDFDDALTALERGDALRYFEFQRAFAGTGKTAQDLVQYMTQHGLQFAPAIPGDEAAYQALQSSLAGYSLALGGN